LTYPGTADELNISPGLGFILLGSPGVRVDWSSLESITNLRIADLACGTGTLLMAVQQAVTDNFVHSRVASGRAIDGEDIKRLHVALIENVLHGYDVLSTAVHLTASTLAVLAPEMAFRRMRLWYLPIGVDAGGGVNLGSIDFLSIEGSPKVAVNLLRDVTGDAGLRPEDRAARMAVTGEGDVLSQWVAAPTRSLRNEPTFYPERWRQSPVWISPCWRTACDAGEDETIARQPEA
jgi:hypothetical protein